MTPTEHLIDFLVDQLLLCWINRIVTTFDGRGTWHQLYGMLHLRSLPQFIFFKRQKVFPDYLQLLLSSASDVSVRSL